MKKHLGTLVTIVILLVAGLILAYIIFGQDILPLVILVLVFLVFVSFVTNIVKRRKQEFQKSLDSLNQALTDLEQSHQEGKINAEEYQVKKEILEVQIALKKRNKGQKGY